MSGPQAREFHPDTLDVSWDYPGEPKSSYADQIVKAHEEKARILDNSPYKQRGWNVVRRLECLRVIQEELESLNEPDQLATVKAITEAYENGDQKWPDGPVSYWSRGALASNLTYFDWDECMKLQKNTKGHGGIWIEGVDGAGPIAFRRFSANFAFPGQLPLAFKPLDAPRDQFYGQHYGSQMTEDDFRKILESTMGFPMPQFLVRGCDTTMILSSGVMAQIEQLGDAADMSIGYSAFHCGNGVLRAYPAVALEVAVAQPNDPPSEWNWVTTRCAVVPGLGDTEIRLSFCVDDETMMEEFVAWELNDESDEPERGPILDQLLRR
ncbi:hypothetical protein N7466_001924 [Penicillium verhagenii]|uniref:uncharacterized protein n=1 Tax=Penicillium verhagenii TaxID=1562060 RepID=UPI00254576FD|nr:uncharacterized protein N7466_001924 [Penicillium verhagenii]KAJ5938790.1 hypothetical protein N7466_001924 [Penicillium verhagenii]